MPDGSLTLFTDLLRRGGTRMQVALFILGSSEYRSNQIQSFYKTFLEREDSDSEIKFFLALWQQGARREQIIAPRQTTALPLTALFRWDRITA